MIKVLKIYMGITIGMMILEYISLTIFGECLFALELPIVVMYSILWIIGKIRNK